MPPATEPKEPKNPGETPGRDVFHIFCTLRHEFFPRRILFPQVKPALIPLFLDLTASALAAGIGLLVLLWSADHLVEAAMRVTRILGLAEIHAGLIVIALGTSLPEICVCLIAAFNGSEDIVTGNVIGSNIANIGLVLGIVCLLYRIVVPWQNIFISLLLLLIATCGAVFFASGALISRTESLLLILLSFLSLPLLIGHQKRGSLFPVEAASSALLHLPEPAAAGQKEALLVPLLSVLGLLVLLLGSSQLTVLGVSHLAHHLGVSEFVISLTMVAVGTSLPELMSSLSAARRGYYNLVLGNVIGSNLYNLLAALGLAGLVHPLEISAGERVNFFLVLAFTLALGLILLLGKKKQETRMPRPVGLLFLIPYILYLGYVAFTGI